MQTDDFDYELPTGLIAQRPVEPRDSCRLLVLDRASGQIDHLIFSDLPDLLEAGDLLVVNETRVLPARLLGVKPETGGAVEVLLLRESYDDTWECLVKPGRKVKPGTHIVFGDGALSGFVVDQLEEGGGRLIRFSARDGSFIEAVHQLGTMPLPPYISEPLRDPEEYQTVFARDERSAAAPTAGLHFTQRLLTQLDGGGVRVMPVELDVGLDTFRPVTEADPTRHRIHTEHVRVPPETVEAVIETKREGGRVIAVGTTSVRALESAFDPRHGRLMPLDASTELFILPGYHFNVVDGVITNFHVPRSTLMMMVSAFAGRELVMHAYEEAIRLRYRFLSFGDAMFLR